MQILMKTEFSLTLIHLTYSSFSPPNYKFPSCMMDVIGKKENSFASDQGNNHLPLL